MPFPVTRLRRLRRNEPLRSMVRETRLTPEAFVYPIFVCPGQGVRKEVRSMPGVFNLSVDEAVKEARETYSLGVPAVILFGLPEKKDEVATGAWADDGIVQRATRAIKREVRDLVVVGDVCLCEYMSHGPCGIVQKKTPAPASPAQRRRNEPVNDLPRPRSSRARHADDDDLEDLLATISLTTTSHQAIEGQAEYEILNDPTLEVLAKTAVAQAKAGMDIIAPSDMMDGRVGAIRKGLDAAGFSNTPILAYAAKFA